MEISPMENTNSDNLDGLGTPKALTNAPSGLSARRVTPNPGTPVFAQKGPQEPPQAPGRGQTWFYTRQTVSADGSPHVELLGHTNDKALDSRITSLVRSIAKPLLEGNRPTNGRPGYRLKVKAVDQSEFHRHGLVRLDRDLGTYVGLEAPEIGRTYHSIREASAALGYANAAIMSQAVSAARRAGSKSVIVRGVTFVRDVAPDSLLGAEDDTMDGVAPVG